ncbi:MAG TPA: hypothetical protein VFT74_11945, partial [Isosphaeraceae bacterium]|nr:hypothetical protein [Isosphaeraceae bacterium]
MGRSKANMQTGQSLRLAWLAAFVTLLLGGLRGVEAGERHPDPNSILPMNEVPAPLRESVADVIRDNSFHEQGKPDTFPCNPRIYLQLLDEPVLTLGL